MISKLHVAVDGFDGFGKSTLCRMLQERFTGMGVPAAIHGRGLGDGTPAVAEITRLIKRIDSGALALGEEANAHLRLARLHERSHHSSLDPATLILFDRWIPSDLSRLSPHTAETHLGDFLKVDRGVPIDLTVRLQGDFDLAWSRILSRPMSEWSPAELEGKQFVGKYFQRLEDIWSCWESDFFSVDASRSSDEVCSSVASEISTLLSSRCS